ncbi:unnamed protein product [Urochloa decumbens]|uniref:Uncharacterized protein n=1 Tax=Urochloa decumbens TaxID=240449 RepID=A0ABC9C1H4_9POAL
MAEVALGLTKTVVEGALSRIQWAIEEEDKLKEGVQQDLEFITGEFQMMQSFLMVANRERAKKNEVVRAWVRQLRDLAFDVENWVELVAHLDKDKSLCSCWWRLVPSWAVPQRLAPPRHLDEAVAEMKLLKARVHDVNQRNTRYNLFNSDDSSSGSGSGLDKKVTTVANLSSRAFKVLRQVWTDETDRLRQEVDSLTNLITSKLIEGDDLEVIWLWGADERYASDHIHKAYHDSEICKSFKCRAWVKILHPFNLQVFLDSLAAQLLFVGSSDQQATNNDHTKTKKNKTNNGLTKTKKNKNIGLTNTKKNKNNNGMTRTAELIQQVTKEQRFLVVLEDVSDLVEWNTIRMCLPDNKKGSRVIVSTQNLRHAILCTGAPYLVSELGWFVEGHPSICAVYKKVPGRSDSAMDILIRKMKLGGVISVYDDSSRKSSVVKQSYLRLLQNQGKMDGKTLFDDFRWVSVADGVSFSLVDFLRRLLLPLSHHERLYDGGDLNELFHIFGGTNFKRLLEATKEELIIEGSRKFLQNEKRKNLVVIHGLRSTKDWDDLKVVARVPWSCQCGGLLVLGSRHWSSGGIQKNYLGRKKRNKFFSYYCWVDVPHPFSLAELSLRIYLEFFWGYPESSEDAVITFLEGDRDPIQECRLLLRQNNKWLLVLDGLRSTDEWDNINDAFSLSEPTPGSMTIIIANEQCVARHCVEKNDEQVVNVQGLKDGEALHLFSKKIDMNNNADMEPEDLDKELSESIMAKCGGLPKVIDAVADYYKVSPLVRSHLKLKDINDNFMQILDRSESLRDLFSWMQSYLETCKDDLKTCIFYLPVFPIGHSIRMRRLLWRLIAEGYIRDTSSNTAEENGDNLLSEIWEFSMFQFQESSKPVKCQVNGFLHEYINSRPMEDNLVFALEGPCGLQSQCVGQHLTIRKKWDRDMNAFQSIDFSRLRSLTVFGDCRPFMFDPAKIKMRYVRVLDLEDASGVTNADLKHIVEAFPRLKFLSLRACREITCLPKSIGGLIQLQTLDVRHTSIAMLPKAIMKLQKLQYVRAGTIHSAPWDEDGIMVPYQTARQEEVQDGTTFAASPLAPAEDTAAAVAATPSAEASEDTTTIATVPLSPAKVATTYTAGPSAPEEDITATTAASSTLAEDVTPVALARSAPPEDATTVAAAQTTLVEDAKMVAACPIAPVENAVTISRSTAAAAAPSNSSSSTISAAAQSALVPSWLSKLCCRSRRRLDNPNDGVEVPAGIGNLTTLHTFGIANVGPGNNSVILKELHKLTRLRRLGVCGINPDNIRKFFSVIAGLNHLEQLSLRLDKDMDGLFASLDSNIARPPKSLDTCLKLHGHVRILPSCSWIKKFVNVKRLDLEVTLQEQHDMRVILDHLMHRTNGFMKRLCMKPVQDGELHIGINDEQKIARLKLQVLEIVCTTNLQATIGTIGAVDVLRVHCSSGSSLQLSGLQEIRSLGEVWLKGTCSDALKEDLQRQLDQRQDKHKPVLKVLQARSP